MQDLKATARLTGLFYLGLAVTGMAGFIIVRPQLYAPGDSAATAANLASKARLARLGVALELASCSPRRWPPCGSGSCFAA